MGKSYRQYDKVKKHKLRIIKRHELMYMVPVYECPYCHRLYPGSDTTAVKECRNKCKATKRYKKVKEGDNEQNSRGKTS